LRYDQFMKFGWKVLIPTSLIWILVLATLRVMSQRAVSRVIVLGFSLGVVLLVLLTSTLYDRSKTRANEAGRLPDMPLPAFPIPALPSFSAFSGQSIPNQIKVVTELELHNG
jgi:NADH-quinone oxidoreductase subunit H